MNYQESLEYLFAQLPMYQKVGRTAFKKDLTNIKKLCAYLGSPQNNFPSIHIAGTNGKGTVSHLLASVFHASGLRVGLYTSPHYEDFRERIKVNGRFIEENFVVRFVQDIKESMIDIKPSFFEFTVAMALEYFRKEEVDLAIIETGLGGRLDSTNILDPLISVITNISLDHCEMLGTDIFHIAHEKAGIIKYRRPVVIGRYQIECDQVFMKKAEEQQAPITFGSLRWKVWKNVNEVIFENKNGPERVLITIDPNQPFLTENIVTALETIKVYNRIGKDPVLDDDVRNGIANFRQSTNYIGRWHKLKDRPLVIADSAHNFDAISTVLHSIKKLKFRKILFVLGFVRDKEVEHILKLFPKDQQYFYVAADIKRSLPAARLKELAIHEDLPGEAYGSVKDGVNSAIKSAHPDDLVLITGSSFVVGEALGLDEKEQREF